LQGSQKGGGKRGGSRGGGFPDGGAPKGVRIAAVLGGRGRRLRRGRAGRGFSLGRKGACRKRRDDLRFFKAGTLGRSVRLIDNGKRKRPDCFGRFQARGTHAHDREMNK